MRNRKEILKARKKRIHAENLTSDVVNINYLLKTEKKVNYSVIDKWMKKITSRYQSLKKRW